MTSTRVVVSAALVFASVLGTHAVVTSGQAPAPQAPAAQPPAAAGERGQAPPAGPGRGGELLEPGTNPSAIREVKAEQHHDPGKEGPGAALKYRRPLVLRLKRGRPAEQPETDDSQKNVAHSHPPD